MNWSKTLDFMRAGGRICPVRPDWGILMYLYIKGNCLWAATNLGKTEFIKVVPEEWKRWEWKDYDEMPTHLMKKENKCVMCEKTITAKGKYKYCGDRCARRGSSQVSKATRNKTLVDLNRLTDDAIDELLVKFNKDLGAALVSLKTIRSLLMEVKESRKLLKECTDVARDEA